MDLDDWLSHRKHLETGSRYMRNCPICELRGARKCVNSDTRLDAEFYERAQKSGRKSIPL
jgi:hypothetical protein